MNNKAKNNKKFGLSLRLNQDTHDWLKQEAKRQRRSMANVILCMLENYINAETGGECLTKNLSIRVPAELHKALQVIATGMECSLNQAINKILTQAVSHCAEFPLEDFSL